MIDDPMEEFLAALQDVALPPGVPVVPDVDAAAHFSVAADVGESSGAWFDVVALESGCLALVVGQVPGSGMAAIAAAGTIGAVLRAGLRHSRDLAVALALVETHAGSSPDARGTVLAVAVINPDEQTLTYAVAGHEPPVVSPADGASRRLLASGPSLGSGATATISVEPLVEGDLVVLASDTPDLLAVVDRSRAGAGDAAATCASVAQDLTGRRTRGAVALAMGALPGRRNPDLTVALQRDDLTTRRARQDLTEWLQRCGATPMDTLSVVHATGELIANSVEHAYADGDGDATVELSACHRPNGEVVVEVVDRGRWRSATDEIGRGRGLAMAAGLVTELTVTTGPDGTRARVVHALTRPVVVGREIPESEWPAEHQVEIHHEAPDHLRLVGDFGHDEVDRVGHEIVLATRGGTRSVLIDLAEIVAVSAGGLRLLGDLARGGDAAGSGSSSVVLKAPHGSTTQVELDRAGIPHDAS